MPEIYRKSLRTALLIVGLMMPLGASAGNAGHAVLSIGQELAGIRSALGLYCMAGMKVKYKDPHKRIAALAAHYEKTLQGIKKDFADPEIQKKIASSESAWAKLKPKMLSAKSQPDILKNNALFIHGHIRSVLKGLEEIKEILLSKADSVNASYINAAIEVGASSKRLSSHYMMKLWKLDDSTIDKHWKSGVKRYKDGIELLKNSPFAKKAAFREKIAFCEKELAFFEMMYQMGKGVPTIIDSKSNRILKASQEMANAILNTK